MKMTSYSVKWINCGLMRDCDIAQEVIVISGTNDALTIQQKNGQGDEVNALRIRLDHDEVQQLLGKLAYISDSWADDYRVPVFDGFAWEATLEFEQTKQIVKGTVKPPPFAHDIRTLLNEMLHGTPYADIGRELRLFGERRMNDNDRRG